MFRMMKLRQNVKGKVLSFAVSLSVLALTIVGAFAVSFKRAAATPANNIMTWSDLADLAYDQFPDNEIVEYFFLYFGNDPNVGIGVDIFNSQDYLVLAAIGSEPGEIAITIWQWVGSGTDYHTDGWQIKQNSIFAKTSSTGGTYKRLGYFFSQMGATWSNDRVSYDDSQIYRTGDAIVTSSTLDFATQSVGSYHNNYCIFPNSSNITNAWFRFYTSRPLYGYNSSVITYPQTIIGAPISRYNNICFSIGNQYYFTFSDQSILQSFIQDSGSAYVPVTFQKNGNTVTYNYYFDELYYTGRSSVNGVTNVGPGGVLAWNITPLVNEYYFDSVVHSHVEPSEVYRDLFANNEAIISWVPYQDPAAQYEYYLEQFQNIVGHSYVANPNELPSYITSGNVGFSQDINAHVIMTGSSAGYVYFDTVAGQYAFDPNVTPNSILVINGAMFDTGFSDPLTQADQDLFHFFTGLLTPDVDLIIVLPNGTWNDLMSQVYDQYNQDPTYTKMSLQDIETFKHHTYYQDWNKAQYFVKFFFTKGIEDNFIVDDGNNSVSGFVFATQRYYTRITNAILAEGFNALQNALDTMTTNQNTFFTGAINSIGAAIYAIDTVGGKLDSIYKYLRYDVDLSDKLTKIVDKLEKIADNTDEQTHDYWFVSLYNWLLQFAPSNSDFATWVSDLTSFENQLPDPEATPAATVIPFPTVTASAG